MRGERELVEVSRYLRQDQAEERALVLLAMGIPYWILPVDGFFSIFVEGTHAAEAFDELHQFDREQHGYVPPPARHVTKPLRPRAPSFSLFVYTWAMIGCFIVQNRGPLDWQTLGSADSALILKGEWWRTVTALTLHGDLPHIVGNLVMGLIFGSALLPWFGTGWAWLSIVASGALGNLLNAWAYRGTPHDSIGASTAVFGALGMLVGQQIAAAIRSHHKPGIREIWFPIAAGLAFLAYLGTQGERVDYTAHGFGMLVGGILGCMLTWFQLPSKTPEWCQKTLATIAFMIPFVAWDLAIHNRG
jgi:membrane associated rhomboid family serine protease